MELTKGFLSGVDRFLFPLKRSGRGYKMLFTVTALTIPSGFLADWNRTHLFNPRWTPHSKFHDAITILLAAFLGIGGLYYLSRSPKKSEELETAVLLPTLFWTSMLLAFAFPGARGLEAEFPDKVPKVGPLWINEAPASLLMLSLLAAGYVAEKKKINSIPLPDSGSNL